VASDEEWPLLLQEALRTAYDTIFRVVDPGTASRNQVLTAFRPMQPNGQWNRMVTLFLGLCQAAGMEVRDAPSQRPGKEAGTAPPKIVLPGRAKARGGPRAVAPAPLPQTAQAYRPPGSLHPALQGIVAAIPELETLDDLERWVTSFKATFQMVKKV